MIEAVLKEEGLQSRSEVVTIDETHATYGNWTHLVEGLCPPSHWYTLTAPLYGTYSGELATYMVNPVPEFSSVEFSFTSTANRIVNNEPWEYLLPGLVTDFIKMHKLDRRVKKMFSTEEFPSNNFCGELYINIRTQDSAIVRNGAMKL